MLHNTENNQHKRKLEFKQFRCGKCKTISEPENHIIKSLSIGRRGCLLAKADCPCCGHKMERLYKQNLEQEIVEFFNVKHNELMTLCNHTCSTSKTHIDKSVKTAPSESLKTAPEREKPDTPSATSKTNINEKQLSLF
ncbi:hypothetical protein N9W34_05390 [Rickettsiales bacterium]|nr:hypothetical protein [Rickettsiales bacterium]